MQKFLLPVILLVSFSVCSQEEETEEKEVGWTSEGQFQLLFNQSAFNDEWTGGGTSNIAANFSVDYDLSYVKNNFSWNNKVLANYGVTKLKGDQFTRKTSDRFEINSIAGLQLPDSDFYYSFFTNFRTQISKGYTYSKPAAGEQQTRTETTSFLSPAYLQFGPGMMYKPNEQLIINLAPATSRFIFVNPDFTTVPGYEDGSYYGVDRGESSRFELGASLTAFIELDVVENVVVENNISLYSNYLSKPGNIDIDYLLNLNMSINEYLTANLIFQAIYDDNAIGAFQIREVFGAGFNYGF